MLGYKLCHVALKVLFLVIDLLVLWRGIIYSDLLWIWASRCMHTSGKWTQHRCEIHSRFVGKRCGADCDCLMGRMQRHEWSTETCRWRFYKSAVCSYAFRSSARASSEHRTRLAQSAWNTRNTSNDAVCYASISYLIWHTYLRYVFARWKPKFIDCAHVSYPS